MNRGFQRNEMVCFTFNKQWHIPTCVTIRLRPSSLTSAFTLTCNAVTSAGYNTFSAAVFITLMSIKPRWTFCNTHCKRKFGHSVDNQQGTSKLIVHTTRHPPLHCPVTLSHTPCSLQLGLHKFSQFGPYNPTGHHGVY